MLSRNALLLVAVMAAQLLHAECGLKILSFNIKNFSSNKLQDQPVVDVLLKVNSFVARVCLLNLIQQKSLSHAMLFVFFT